MSVEKNDHTKSIVRSNALKVSKAAVKATIICLVYIILSRLLAPISVILPNFQQIIAAFVVVYIVLMVAGDLASGTIFQYVLNAMKASFVIAYLILALNTGIFKYTVGNTNLVIDLRMFLMIVMFFGLLGIAKSVLGAIDLLNEKSEIAIA